MVVPTVITWGKIKARFEHLNISVCREGLATMRTHVYIVNLSIVNVKPCFQLSLYLCVCMLPIHVCSLCSVFPKNRQQTKLPGSNTFLVGSNHKFYIEMYLEIQVWPVQSCLSPLTMKIRENTAFVLTVQELWPFVMWYHNLLFHVD